MTQINELHENRLLNPAELSQVIVHQRKERGWTQDVLAELSGINLRTIQRVENGESSSLDTRRALARALDWQDIDAFSKPWPVPNVDKLKEEAERLERETIPLSLEKITTGRQLRELTEGNHAFQFSQLLELSLEGGEAFSELQDYLKEYGDCYDLYSATQKLDVNKDIQRLIDDLAKAGYMLGAAIRKVRWRMNTGDDAKPCIMSVLTVMVGSASAFPQTVRIPKAGQFKI